MIRGRESILERMYKRQPPVAEKAERPKEQGVRDLIILGILMLIFILNCIICFTFLEEDAFIDFRYAANLADGNGFVFNPGEEPVEGFSNFLWLIIVYVFRSAGSDAVAAARIIGILLGIGTMYLSFLVVRNITENDGALNLMPAAMMAFSPPLIFWYQAGLESALYSFLIIGLVHFHLQEGRRTYPLPLSGLFCLFLALTRPEGALFFILFIILKFRPALQDDAKLRSYIAWFFICFIPLLVFVVLRFSIFHSLLPNTYYAKMNYDYSDAVRIGGAYTLAFFIDSRAWLWLLPFLAVFAWCRGEKFWRYMLPLIVFIAYVLSVLYVGGDFHIYYRFYAPLLPLLFIACALGLWEIRNYLDDAGGPGLAVVVAGILALFMLFVSSAYYRSPAWRDIEEVSPMDRSMLYYRYQSLARDPSMFDKMLDDWFQPPGDILDITGKWLADEYPKETRLATEQCGKVPYYTQFHTYDLLGLNSKETARIIHYRRSFDQYLQAFKGADADIVLLYFADGKFVDQEHIGRLVESAEFQGMYELVRILNFDYVYRLDEEYHRGRQMLLFERKGVVEEEIEVEEVEEEAVEAKPGLGVIEMIEAFLEVPEVEEVEEPAEEVEEGEAAPEVEEGVITFVVEL